MALELEDFDRSFVTKGASRGIFNSARVDCTDPAAIYCAYKNEWGSFIISRISISGSVYTMEYYAVGKKPDAFASAWTNRASLSYVEYNALFPG